MALYAAVIVFIGLHCGNAFDNRLSADLVNAIGGEEVPTNIENIEENMWPTFQALPKNMYGRLDLSHVGYAVQRHFAAFSDGGSGRRLSGLFGSEGLGLAGVSLPRAGSNFGGNNNDTRLTQLLAEVAAALGRSARGFSVGEVARIIAILERHVSHETESRVTQAHESLNSSKSEDVSEQEFVAVVGNYLKASYRDISEVDVADAARSAVQSVNFHRRHEANPFVPGGQERYSFEKVREGADIAVAFVSEARNQACAARRAWLQNLSEPGTGRVALGKLYASAGSEQMEGPSALRDLGVVEDDGAVAATLGSSPRLLIADYMLLPTSCPFRGETYSICCVSECADMVQVLEAKVQAPVASPDRVLRIVNEFLHLLSETPRVLPPQLTRQLNRIAKTSGGDIPLHSDAFVEWLHYAFPNECPLRHPQPLKPAAAVASDAEAAKKLTQAVIVPYTWGRMLADYAAGRGRGGSVAPTATDSNEKSPLGAVSAPRFTLPPMFIAPADFGRMAVCGLLGFAMLRASLAHWREAARAKAALDGSGNK
eukprot:TRINITY_DN75469_c0_g1_i1.p1 TRINITY_DN75469_c0_g1~~TRINITY_DN75469_c0_g1_i1.p1  ORF type:complete len:575 (-),score=86.21 TRINITY_DN75469_c0_g1_i1:116-1738(-)